MTKQVEMSLNSIQETTRNKRDLLDKRKSSNLEQIIIRGKSLEINKKIESKSQRKPLKDNSSSTDCLRTESKTSYKNIDYSTTSTSLQPSSCLKKQKSISVPNIVKNLFPKFSSISSLYSSTDQESSLLDVSFSSSAQSQLYESAIIDRKTYSKSNSNTSVTCISDYSENTLMDENFVKTDKTLKSEKCENGWTMTETIIKPLTKSSLIKGECSRNSSKTSKNGSSSTLSALNSESKFESAFSKDLIYPISLRYYHHLFNQKSKKAKNKNKISTPLLYNKIISGSKISSQSSSSSSTHDIHANLINNKKTDLNKYFDLMNDLIQYNKKHAQSSNSTTTTTSSTISESLSRDQSEIKRVDKNSRKISGLNKKNDICKSYDENFKLKKNLHFVNGLKTKSSKSTTHLDNDLSDLLDKILEKKSYRSKSELRNSNKLNFKSSSPPRTRKKADMSSRKFLLSRTKKNYGKYERSSEDTFDTSLDLNEKVTGDNNKELKLSIDTKNSGGGLVTAEIKLNDKMVKFDLNKVDDTKYELKLIPKQVGDYKVYMYLNNESVKGSPYSFKIDDIEKFYADSINSEYYRKKLLSSIDDYSPRPSSQLGFGESFNTESRDSVAETIFSSNRSLKTDVFELSNKSEDLIVGEEVKLNVKVIEYVKRSKKNPSSIDTKVTHNDKLINHKLDVCSNGMYQIKFFPLETGIYNVYFFKGGKKIDGCPYKLNIKGRYLREVVKPNYAQVGVPYVLNVEYCNTTNLKVIAFTQKERSGSLLSLMSKKNIAKLVNIPVEKTIESDSKLRLKFLPLHPSEHIIDIIDNGLSIEGFPMKINVFPNKEIFLINENINGIKLGSVAKFRIYLNGQNDSLNIKITDIDSDDGQYVTFLLNEQYQQPNHIFGALCKFLRINTNRIKNRDITIENGQTRVIFAIAEEESQLSNNYILKELKQIIENEKFVIIDLGLNKTVKAVKSSFKCGAKGENVGFKLMKQINKPFDYLGEFRPRAIGRYRIDVDNFNIPINNSPFFVNVYDPLLVQIVHMPHNFTVGTEDYIEVNLSKAGFSEFEAIIESPNGIKLPYKIETSFNHVIRFIAREKGLHKVYMKLGESFATEKPYEIMALESNYLNVYGNGLYTGIENTYVLFYAQLTNFSIGKLDFEIHDPKNNPIKVYVTKLEEFMYEIKYIPQSIGKYKISIKFNDEQIPSSPFYANIINPDKVKILDDCQYFFNVRNFDLELNEEKSLCLSTSEAGDGDIRVDIMAPNNEKLPYRKTNPSSHLHKFNFYPVYEGQYKIKIFLNNRELCFSPIVAKTIDYSIINDVKVYGDGLVKADLNRESNFFIDCSRIKGLSEKLEVSAVAISENSKELEIKISNVQENIYNCSYKPENIGFYLLSIKVNQHHVIGSPFTLKVGLDTDPSKIIIKKEDLKFGILGNELSTIIDTKNAGPGELRANCSGLSKPAHCELIDKKDGLYELKIRPVEAGKHILFIKYNDFNVPNSPFVFRVSSPPDETKVEVYGPGITHGVIGSFNSEFFCDTKGAGAGQLTVRIRGPKGAFRVDMQRKDERDRTIECKYDPLETGEYQINVKWSGKHVPNSPFNVLIFKTKEELDKYLAEYSDENIKNKIGIDQN